jgi:hypothetical protein
VTSGLEYNLYYTCGAAVGGAAAASSPHCNATCGYADAALLEADLAAGGDGRGFATCSCARVAALVGDAGSLRAAAFGLSARYSESSRATASSLAAYLAARSAYDAAYAYNHTEPLRAAFSTALHAVNGAFAPTNFTFGQLGLDLDAELLACASLRPTADHTPCALAGFESLQELYAAARADLEQQVAAAAAGVASYGAAAASLAARVAAAQAFFVEFWQGVADLGLYVADDSIEFPNVALEDLLVRVASNAALCFLSC